MLGHVFWQDLSKYSLVYGTVRDDKAAVIAKYPTLFKSKEKNIIEGIDALSPDGACKAIEKIKPNIVINCIGIVKQLKEAQDPILSISINALFPHLVAEKCAEKKARLIHISTDCVFSGKKGLYRETDIADADDLYGRTKYLGEVNSPNCLTVRTSLIGRELREKKSLLEWFLAQKGQVRGYKKAVFSGLTTYALTQIIKEIILKYPELNGIYHIAGGPINKYELLTRLKDIYKKDIEIIPDETVKVDRSLDASKFRDNTSIKIPSWDEMLEDLRRK